MNLDLCLKNIALSLPEVVEGSVVDQHIAPYDFPSLQQVLRKMGPLPDEALCLGIAEDGLPILLNLWDPLPGPVLIAGDSQAGMTNFLQTLSRFAVATHHADQIQYGVITNHSHRWDDYADNACCIGIFSQEQGSVTNFLRALVAWIEVNHSNKQSVLLLIDGLEDVLIWNPELIREFDKILVSGPAKGVWPFITINLEHCQAVKPWLKYFRTRVFGYTVHTQSIDDDYSDAEFEGLLKGIEFSLKEKGQWTKFWIPTT